MVAVLYRHFYTHISIQCPARVFINASVQSYVLTETGATTAKKLWSDARATPTAAADIGGDTVNCTCCMTYKEWNTKHPSLGKSLQLSQLCSTRFVQMRVTCTGLKGPCTGMASNAGQHPYTCDTLAHGKTSPLNRLGNTGPTLKHPRTDVTCN